MRARSRTRPAFLLAVAPAESELRTQASPTLTEPGGVCTGANSPGNPRWGVVRGSKRG